MTSITSTKAIAPCGRIIGRLQLMSTTAGHDLPTDPIELAKLARLLNYADGAKLMADCDHYRLDNRRRFERLFTSPNR